MKLTTKLVTSREDLFRLAEDRLEDFEALRAAGRYAAAIYLGVYAVECLLKAHICKVLDLRRLPAVFKTHDLQVLLLHSGLNQRIRSVPEVYDNLRKLDNLWNPAVDERNIRYLRDPVRFGRSAADQAAQWLKGPAGGVVAWLREQL